MYEMRPPRTAPGSYSDNPYQPPGEAETWKAASGLGGDQGGGTAGASSHLSRSNSAGTGEEEEGGLAATATAGESPIRRGGLGALRRQTSVAAASASLEANSEDGKMMGGTEDAHPAGPLSSSLVATEREVLRSLPLFEIGRDFVLFPGECEGGRGEDMKSECWEPAHVWNQLMIIC